MIEYENIPIHIRITNRHLIDPNYKDDSTFWRKLSEPRSEHRRLGADEEERTSKLKPTAQAMWDILKEESREVTQSEIAAMLGVTTDTVTRTAENLMRHCLLYEGFGAPTKYGVAPKKAVTYGLLKEDE